MRVMATRQGQYCNMLIEAGWVFDLLMNEDGSMPEREDWIPVLAQDPITKKMVDTGDGEFKVYLDPRTKKPVHRDYSPDEGNVMLRKGPIRGESVNVGWMVEAPAGAQVTMIGNASLNELLADCHPGVDPRSRRHRRVHPSLRRDAEVVGPTVSVQPAGTKPVAQVA
jgi:hypothetical protein